jgi:pyruvate-formate lyase-activating enzyme
MKKILCLGNNTRDTDNKSQLIAAEYSLPGRGLLSELENTILLEMYQDDGVYHSSIYDVEFGKLVWLCNQFDQVIMLDQPKDQWSHPDAYYRTIKVLESTDSVVVYRNPDSKTSIDYFENLVQVNKSFCIFPFIEMLVNFDSTTVCCRSNAPVVKLNDLKDFSTDPNYTKIRNKMINGEKLEKKYCGECYDLESRGMISARQQETVEWANRLNLKNIQDLKKIVSPAYYEIRPDNKCNLLCRSCNPSSSHLIDREYKKLQIIEHTQTQKRHVTGFDIINFDQLKKLYIAGGEPTIISKFYQFLDQCIDQKNTNFEILVNTNGTTLKEKLKQQLKYFSNFQFIFSIDGYDKLNHYIRYPSDWNSIIENWSYLREHGHKVFVNTTVSIYNIDTLDILCEYIDHKFPGTLIHLTILKHPEFMSPFFHPDADKVLKSLQRIKTLMCYKNDHLFASIIDGLIQHFHYEHKINNDALTNFFVFNDRLDHSRNIFLNDYCDSLEQYRP